MRGSSRWRPTPMPRSCSRPMPGMMRSGITCPTGPFASAAALPSLDARHGRLIRRSALLCHPRPARAAWEGVASYLRITPEAGTIEVGQHRLRPASCSARRAATEAMFLMMAWAFEAGYRRYEWKCNALNHPSRRAAQRLGLQLRRRVPAGAGGQGPQPRHRLVRRHRRRMAGAARGLSRPGWRPANFDAAGQQRERLSDLTSLVRVVPTRRSEVGPVSRCRSVRGSRRQGSDRRARRIARAPRRTCSVKARGKRADSDQQRFQHLRSPPSAAAGPATRPATRAADKLTGSPAARLRARSSAARASASSPALRATPPRNCAT